MNLFGMMETSGSAMEAERMRAEVVAANAHLWPNAEGLDAHLQGSHRRREESDLRRRGQFGLSGFMNDSINASTSATTNTDAGRIGAGEPSAELPPLLPLTGAPNTAPGVHIAQVVEDPSPPLKRYDPGHPDAGPDGYVAYPDINPLTEMVDLMGATPCLWPQWLSRPSRKGHDRLACDCEKLGNRD